MGGKGDVARTVGFEPLTPVAFLDRATGVHGDRTFAILDLAPGEGAPITS